MHGWPAERPHQLFTSCWQITGRNENLVKYTVVQVLGINTVSINTTFWVVFFNTFYSFSPR